MSGAIRYNRCWSLGCASTDTTPHAIDGGLFWYCNPHAARAVYDALHSGAASADTAAMIREDINRLEERVMRHEALIDYLVTAIQRTDSFVLGAHQRIGNLFHRILTAGDIFHGEGEHQ